jgi:hypothetical protein
MSVAFEQVEARKQNLKAFIIKRVSAEKLAFISAEKRDSITFHRNT